jgi:transposase
VAGVGRRADDGLDARAAAVIRIDAVWLATLPVDMRAGVDRLLAQVVSVFGCAHAHHGYLFANARGTRIKLLVHDGFGIWCASRRLNVGRFVWVPMTSTTPATLQLTREQFDALVLGLPWQRLSEMKVIARV